MTRNQKSLVQKSFQSVEAIADTTATLFYEKLFELNPSLKSMFEGDTQEQGRKFMTMISAAVSVLDRFEEIIPALQALGARHAGYGVSYEDYDTVGKALMWTLQTVLDGQFTPEVEEAWSVVYASLADTMKSAASMAA